MLTDPLLICLFCLNLRYTNPLGDLRRVSLHKVGRAWSAFWIKNGGLNTLIYQTGNDVTCHTEWLVSLTPHMFLFAFEIVQCIGDSHSMRMYAESVTYLILQLSIFFSCVCVPVPVSGVSCILYSVKVGCIDWPVVEHSMALTMLHMLLAFPTTIDRCTSSTRDKNVCTQEWAWTWRQLTHLLVLDGDQGCLGCSVNLHTELSYYWQTFKAKLWTSFIK